MDEPQTNKDTEQDELIRRNAEHIRKNEEAIERQTACLEKIRDHYFPHKTFTKRLVGFLLKVFGAVTVYAGLMETADWYFNTRQSDAMAAESALVARQLLLQENDPVGAMNFLEKAVELDAKRVKYRIALASVKGLAAIMDFFDLGRPLTIDERERLDAILAEALFLQQVAPEEPMPWILAAQIHRLCGEEGATQSAVARALALAPDDPIVHISACALSVAFKRYDEARREIAAAEKLAPQSAFVPYWRGCLAFEADGDRARARELFAEMVRRAPQSALARLMHGRMLITGPKPDIAAGRAELERAHAIMPKMKAVYELIALSYELEGNFLVARLWLDRLLALDAKSMRGLVAHARVARRLGEAAAARADLDAAVALAPFDAELYLKRAELRESQGDAAGAKADRATAKALKGR